MKRRRLGRTELELPVVVFGAYALGGGYWGRVDDREAAAAVHAALEAGMDAFDTAPVYGLGHSERVLGAALRSAGGGGRVLTKVGLRWEGGTGADGFRMPDAAGKPRPVERNSRPESVRWEVEQSLGRLGVERLDLVQVHTRDPRTPVAETLGALSELRAEGLVGEIGVSNYNLEELEEARLALDPIPLASDQPHYSLLTRGIEDELVPWALEHRVGLVVYAALEQGLLTGCVREDREFDRGEGRANNSAFSPENRRRVNAVLDRVVAPIAAGHGVTLAQVVLAWTAGRPGISAVLAGARSPRQARENAVAGSLELAEDERAAIAAGFEGLELLRPRPGLVERLRWRLGRWLGRR